MTSGSAAAFPCPLPTPFNNLNPLNGDLCTALEEAGCPLGHPVHERVRFETLLAEMSANFVHLPAAEVDAHIDVALRRLVEFLDVDRCGLAEVRSDQKKLVVTHSYHKPGVPLLPPILLDEEMPWYARIIHEGKVFRVSRLPEELPVEATHERAYCQAVGLKSHIMIPLRTRDAVTGAIGFGSFRDHRVWPDELIPRLRLVGEIFTWALARKHADEALQKQDLSLRQTREGLRILAAKLLHAQEEERRRIAREMHDDWTQRLALLSIDITRLEQHIGSPETALPLLYAMQEQLVSLSEDVHALSRRRHPSLLADLGLVEALRSECASFSRREGIAVFYDAEEVPPRIPKDVALCVYRVVQEALRNLAKHAAVNQAWVRVRAPRPDLVVTVQDRGRGFDAAARTEPGLGLASMEERVRLIQGTFAVTSAPGQGTTVEVRIPLETSAP